MTEVPTLCAQCLGDKDHVKMVRQPHGEQCKLCTRPFTVFRWNLSEARNKLNKTILCNTCATARNCCQACMIDVDYCIPIDIRDAALKMARVENPYAVNVTSRNSEVRAIMADKMEERKQKLESGHDEKHEKARAILEVLKTKLSNEDSKSARPKAKIVDVSTKELSKTIAKLPFGGTLQVPEDASVKSFFVFGFSQDIPQYELTAHFEKHGSVALAKIVHQARCGYITYTKRSSAEDFAADVQARGLSKNPKTAGLVSISKRELVRVSWGSPRPLGSSKDENSKLLQVVTKVMKQLADKDESARNEGRGKKKAAGKEKQERVTPTYKALSADVEL